MKRIGNVIHIGSGARALEHAAPLYHRLRESKQQNWFCEDQHIGNALQASCEYWQEADEKRDSGVAPHSYSGSVSHVVIRARDK
jgi:hypothetical protein